MDRERLILLMQETLTEAGKSVARVNQADAPLVGALLVTPEGQILCRAHRGELNAGDHAEYCLFVKARKAGIDPRNKILFVTLEPCTYRRSEQKIPCAERVVDNHIACVYIGTLDPNPQITGRGETYLSYNMRVERFLGELADEIRTLNRAF